MTLFLKFQCFLIFNRIIIFLYIPIIYSLEKVNLVFGLQKLEMVLLKKKIKIHTYHNYCITR